MSDIVPSVSITNMVNQRQAAMERIRQAVALLSEAHALCNKGNLGFPPVDVTQAGGGGSYRVCSDKPEEVMDVFRRHIDSGAWRHLMHESGLRSFMDAKTRSRWDSQIYEASVPHFTHDNVIATFTAMHEQRGEMFDQGVISCFKSLSWKYKTNLPQKFGKRIIIKSLCPQNGGVYHQRADELDDLMRVFHVLERKPQADHRHGMYGHLTDAFLRGHKFPYHYRNEYMEIKIFKNGNAHLLFLKSELVDQLNAIIAKHFPDALAAPK